MDMTTFFWLVTAAVGGMMGVLLAHVEWWRLLVVCGLAGALGGLHQVKALHDYKATHTCVPNEEKQQ